MSLRWIHENCEPPVCDEESSDIDDSCSDDSYDSDLMPVDDSGNNNNNANPPKIHWKLPNQLDDPDTVTTNREPRLVTAAEEAEELEKRPAPRLPSDPRLVVHSLERQSLKLKLFCRTGYYIGITSSGRVKGYPADSSNDAHVLLVLSPVTYGVVRLQSAQTGHYLAFNATGHLYGELKMNKDNTEWEQWKAGKYDAFRSHKYAESGWWLGIKKNGRHQPGPKTSWTQKATQFVPIRLA